MYLLQFFLNAFISKGYTCTILAYFSLSRSQRYVARPSSVASLRSQLPPLVALMNVGIIRMTSMIVLMENPENWFVCVPFLELMHAICSTVSTPLSHLVVGVSCIIRTLATDILH